MTEKLLNEISVFGKRCASTPPNDCADAAKNSLPYNLLRKNKPELPEISEPELIRHFTRLSKLNYSLAANFYPLGSCTMKYNPIINEKITALDGFTNLHPLQNQETTQGILEALFDLQNALCEISGMDAFTLQPSAGANGEFAGLLIARAYFKSIGQKRTKIIVPDSAHGTNPASAALAGFEIVSIHSELDGHIDSKKLKAILNSDVACLMFTVPNTLGVFEKEILEICSMAHDNGSLLYYDGANLNALIGMSKPADLGFDIMHINLHKTFSTPHGGGGPGAGPVGVKKHLKEFLPVPVISKNDSGYYLDYSATKTIGMLRSFYGNIPVLLKAYSYILALGCDGIRESCQQAVINANYLLALLIDVLPAPAGNRCLHEFVLSGKPLKEFGVRTIDIAKRLLDYGYYAPTIYFPIIVEEAIMIEPTETESKQTLDEFANILKKVLIEAKQNSELLKTAPVTTPVSRLNEVEAARKPILKY